MHSRNCASACIAGYATLSLSIGPSRCFWYRQASQPAFEGTLALPGLADSVQVRRDAQAIPTIVASNEHDAIFVLGFVHAQDRLWQMEFNRRLASGRLAEVLGASALPTDQFLRTLGVHRIAQAIYER
jgi:penicillin amidase